MRGILFASSLFSVLAVNAQTPCICTEYSQIAPAVASCTSIFLQNILAPTNSSIDLSKLKSGSVVTFQGTTTFEFTNSSSFDVMIFGGKNVTITSDPDAIIDGGGQMYWDGLGSNGGVPKPNHFIVVKMKENSLITGLTIKNWPVHLFYISSSSDLTVSNLDLDNGAGNAPNDRSGGKAAAHNSDGIDISGSTNVLIDNIRVNNQDDCVAITSGDNITVQNMYCEGTHGLSIGSVGGKSNNNVTNILFRNSTILNSSNGARIKSNYNTTGFISNITYTNIQLSNITDYGIDIQQDYLNGGPTGSPSNGVLIQNILIKNVTGTMSTSTEGKGINYNVLCGEGSCTNFVFEDVRVIGGRVESFCNFPEGGCPV